ncbi:MAG: preprotein translocase subunit YajC [Treponema sp. CETP13]|nr:MAG: preprotein translocase subunit YajC [Treponema sp. CETP13]
MVMNFLLQAQSSQQGMLMTILPFLLIFVIFYFFLIRPQNKKQKQTEKMISAIKKGDKITTIGGIHGVVSSTKEKTIIVKVDDNCKLEFSRTAVASVDNPKKETVESVGKKAKQAKIDETTKDVVDET